VKCRECHKIQLDHRRRSILVGDLFLGLAFCYETIAADSLAKHLGAVEQLAPQVRDISRSGRRCLLSAWPGAYCLVSCPIAERAVFRSWTSMKRSASSTSPAQQAPQPTSMYCHRRMDCCGRARGRRPSRGRVLAGDTRRRLARSMRWRLAPARGYDRRFSSSPRPARHRAPAVATRSSGLRCRILGGAPAVPDRRSTSSPAGKVRV